MTDRFIITRTSHAPDPPPFWMWVAALFVGALVAYLCVR